MVVDPSILRAGMSPRQVEICDALTGGRLGTTNAELARMLGIAERTVKAHFNKLFLTFRVRNRVELLVELHRLGYLAPPDSQVSPSIRACS